MESVSVGFKAFDIHELACHFVARHAGLYARHGLEVRLVDTTFGAAEPPSPPPFSAACGAALLEWLGGADRKVVFVAAERPMFWLYATPGVSSVADLAGRAIAGYPDGAPPALLLRAILNARSVDTGSVTVLPARDDVGRIGLLGDGSASAAVVSSAVAPQSLEARGLRELLWFGDDIRVPTTGLAMADDVLAAHGEIVTAMCTCYREALTLIHDAIGVLEAAIGEHVTTQGAGQGAMADRVRRAYSRDGRISRHAAEVGAAALANALGVTAMRPIDSLYGPALSTD